MSASYGEEDTAICLLPPLPRGQFGSDWQINSFCMSVDAFLAEHPSNVVGIHCKAGKGRTGEHPDKEVDW
jgi:hypothetical protein